MYFLSDTFLGVFNLILHASEVQDLMSFVSHAIPGGPNSILSITRFKLNVFSLPYILCVLNLILPTPVV